MPTYQYQCTECGEGLEVVQKFTEDSLTECPACQGRLKKVFSAVGIVFKGSGFYRNDSRSGSSSSGSSAPSASKDSKESKDSSSSAKSESSSSDSGKSSSDSSGSSGSSASKDSGGKTPASTSA
ncbi:FmdB family zinc ribbon protein [Streptomyces sp. NPDC005438]|uniref:FmdB family zinc ribbon protein n=1 Tax=Streptomyces sp. NPDC005438 TaxID=3156880 RepID=UPI0033BDC970